MTEKKTMNKQKYLPQAAILILIVILTTIGPFSTDMYLPALMEMVEFFGTTEAILNMSLYGFLFFQAVAILLLGTLSDKYGRKLILLTSIIVYVITSIFAALAPSIELFIICRMFQGAASGGMLVISMALVKDCFEEKVRNTVLTLSVVLGAIGPIASPVLGAYLIEAINWQSTLIFPGLISIICLVLTVFFTESLPDEERFTGSIPGVLKNMAGICKHRNFTLFLVAMGIFALPFMAYLAVSSYIFEGMFGLSSTEYSYLLALNAILGTAGMLILQRLVKGRSNTITGVVIIILSLISGLMMLSVGHMNAALCFVGMTFCVLASFAARPYALGILLQQFDGDTGAVSSLFNFAIVFIGCIGMVCGTLPWPTYIVGLGVCSLAAGAIAAVLWLLMQVNGEKLKGL